MDEDAHFNGKLNNYCSTLLFLCVSVTFFSESSLNGHHDIPLGVRINFFQCMLNAALSKVTTDSHVIKRCEIFITIYTIDTKC